MAKVKADMKKMMDEETAAESGPGDEKKPKMKHGKGKLAKPKC